MVLALCCETIDSNSKGAHGLETIDSNSKGAHGLVIWPIQSKSNQNNESEPIQFLKWIGLNSKSKNSTMVDSLMNRYDWNQLDQQSK